MSAQVISHPFYRIKRQVENANVQYKEAMTWTNCSEADYLAAKYRDWEAVFKWSPALFGEDMRFTMEWGAVEWNYAVKTFNREELYIAVAYENYLQDGARKDAAERGLLKE